METTCMCTIRQCVPPLHFPHEPPGDKKPRAKSTNKFIYVYISFQWWLVVICIFFFKIIKNRWSDWNCPVMETAFWMIHQFRLPFWIRYVSVLIFLNWFLSLSAESYHFNSSLFLQIVTSAISVIKELCIRCKHFVVSKQSQQCPEATNQMIINRTFYGCDM